MSPRPSIILLSAVAALLVAGCAKNPSLPPVSPADSIAVVEENLAHRAEAEAWFRAGEGSPFLRDTTISFSGLRWYPVDPRMRVRSAIHRYADPETVTVMGTKGEERRQLRYGYFEFTLPDGAGGARSVRLNVYKFTPHDAKRYELYRNNLSVWFTDETTGKETYEVGRYLELGEENTDPAFVYTLDFNKAFNPYCAYSHLYSCAIPGKEDHLALPLRAGELPYHP